MISFPAADALDSPEWQKVGAMQASYFAERRRSGPAFGQMVINSRDQEEIEDGPSRCAVRYTNPSRFSRLRGGGAW